MNNSIIDGLVAEKVMKWSKKQYGSYAYWEDGTGRVSIPEFNFQPTDQIAQAWQVVQQLASDGIDWAIGTSDSSQNSIGARFGIHEAIGRTAAEAVCIAALKFKGVDM